MTPTYLPLDASKHRQHGWRRTGANPFVGSDASPILIAELGQAVAHYPLAFRVNESGKFELVAVQGLLAGVNLFINANGQWIVPYISSRCRAHPFALLHAEVEGKQLVMLGFDTGSGLYREEPNPQQNDARFFDNDGKLTPWMQQLVQFLGESEKNRVITQRAVDVLAEAKLLEPWVLPKPAADTATPLRTDLYRINAAAMQGLPGKALEALRNCQALDIVYAHFLSTGRLASLHAITAARAAQQRKPEPMPQSLDSLFGEGQNHGTISFDWLKNR